MNRAITTRLGTLMITILAALALMGARECEFDTGTPDGGTPGDDGSPDDDASPGDEANCIDGVDDDDDGVTDCDDLDCQRDPACWEADAEICDDRADNDGDGLIDCGDEDCAADAACEVDVPEDCGNRLDDDGDGATDCADDDCAADPACTVCGEVEVCSGGADDDCDGHVDCDDPECARDPECYDDGSSEAPCDLVAQDCADATERCYPGGETAAEGVCYSTGDRGLGEPCVEPPVDVPEACSEGLLCLYESEESLEGACYQICGLETGCAEGFACHALRLDDVTVTSDWGVCTPILPESDCANGADDDIDGLIDCDDPDCAAELTCTICDPFTQDCRDADEMCVMHDTEYPECVPEGTRTEGQTCTSATACARGLQCAAISGMDPTAGLYWFTFNESYLTRGPGYCLALCHYDDASLCDAGEICAPVGNSWDGSPRPEGVCYEPL